MQIISELIQHSFYEKNAISQDPDYIKITDNYRISGPNFNIISMHYFDTEEGVKGGLTTASGLNKSAG